MDSLSLTSKLYAYVHEQGWWYDAVPRDAARDKATSVQAEKWPERLEANEDRSRPEQLQPHYTHDGPTRTTDAAITLP